MWFSVVGVLGGGQFVGGSCVAYVGELGVVGRGKKWGGGWARRGAGRPYGGDYASLTRGGCIGGQGESAGHLGVGGGVWCGCGVVVAAGEPLKNPRKRGGGGCRGLGSVRARGGAEGSKTYQKECVCVEIPDVCEYTRVLSWEIWIG